MDAWKLNALQKCILKLLYQGVSLNSHRIGDLADMNALVCRRCNEPIHVASEAESAEEMNMVAMTVTLVVSVDDTRVEEDQQMEVGDQVAGSWSDLDTAEEDLDRVVRTHSRHRIHDEYEAYSPSTAASTRHASYGSPSTIKRTIFCFPGLAGYEPDEPES